MSAIYFRSSPKTLKLRKNYFKLECFETLCVSMSKIVVICLTTLVAHWPLLLFIKLCGLLKKLNFNDHTIERVSVSGRMTFSSVMVAFKVVLSKEVTLSKVWLLWISVLANSSPVMGSKVLTWDRFVSSNDETSANNCNKNNKHEGKIRVIQGP